MAFKFEELRVWQKALDMTGSVNELTKSFPKDERFVLSSQIQRAADSIALNIAEGSTGQSNKEFARFLGFSLRSAIEVVGCLHIGKKRSIINPKEFDSHYQELTELVKMIQALRKTLR